MFNVIEGNNDLTLDEVRDLIQLEEEKKDLYKKSINKLNSNSSLSISNENRGCVRDYKPLGCSVFLK